MSKGQGKNKLEMAVEHEKEYENNPRDEKDEFDNSVSKLPKDHAIPNQNKKYVNHSTEELTEQNHTQSKRRNPSNKGDKASQYPKAT